DSKFHKLFCTRLINEIGSRFEARAFFESERLS
ncbi:MAG: hypothetical protein RLZZ576_735, partial [Actinomycetota bacterium]